MTSSWQELETQLQDVLEQARLLQDRLHQIREAEREQGELQRRITDLESQKVPKEELEHLRDRLDLIEVDLESRLLTWDSFKEPFWQVVRFGGMGVLVGAALRSCM